MNDYVWNGVAMMSKEKFAELAKIEWKDDFCLDTVTVSVNEYMQISMFLSDIGKPETKALYENAGFTLLNNHIKEKYFPESKEVSDELRELVWCLNNQWIASNDVNANSQMYFKGEPLSHFLERMADKLEQ